MLSLSKGPSFYKTNDGSPSNSSFGSRDRVPSLRIMGEYLSNVQTSTSPVQRSLAPFEAALKLDEACQRLDTESLVKETEIAEEYCAGTSLAEQQLSPTAVLLFLLHVTRWLYKQHIRETPSTVSVTQRKAQVCDAIRKVCSLVKSSALEELSLKKWNALFDEKGENDPALWVLVLKTFVFQFEVIPVNTASQLLDAYNVGSSLLPAVPIRSPSVRKSSLGGLFSTPSSSPASPLPVPVQGMKEAFVPLLEDLSSTRHQVLGGLCLLLSRDRRNRRQVVSVFGPWLLLDRDSKNGLSACVQEERQMSKLRSCAELMELLVSVPDSLFGLSANPLPGFSDQDIGEISPTSSNGGGNEKPPTPGHRLRRHGSSFLKRGTSLRLMIKRFSTGIGSANPLLSPNHESNGNSLLSDEDADKVLQNLEQVMHNRFSQALKDMPARSRESLEKVYGRAPPPPPSQPPAAASPSLSSAPISPMLSSSASLVSSSLSKAAPVAANLHEQLKATLKRNNLGGSTTTPVMETKAAPPSLAIPARKTSTTGRQPPPVPTNRPLPLAKSNPAVEPQQQITCSQCQTTFNKVACPVCPTCADAKKSQQMMHNGVKLIPLGELAISGVRNTSKPPAIPSTRPAMGGKTSVQKSPITLAAQASARRRSLSKETV